MTDLALSRRALWLAPVALALAACHGTSPAARPVSLSLATGSGVTPTSVAADLQIGTGANSLTISGAQMVLARIELSPNGTCATTGEEDDCDELQAGPGLVTLPVDGTTKVILDALVPPGTYDALHAKLDAVTPDDDETGAAAFLALHPDFQGVSVKVTGSFTDASNMAHSFTFTSDVDAEIAAMFNPAVTVGASTSNLTIAVDVASWFKDATGAAIDPTNAANADAINNNIRASFHVFEDDNHDGMDDHEEGGGGTPE
jgi:hypothetical protein